MALSTRNSSKASALTAALAAGKATVAINGPSKYDAGRPFLVSKTTPTLPKPKLSNSNHSLKNLLNPVSKDTVKDTVISMQLQAQAPQTADTQTVATKGLPTPPHSLSPIVSAPLNTSSSSPPLLKISEAEEPSATRKSTSTARNRRATTTADKSNMRATSSNLAVINDATGDITPALLARHHLPKVLLHNEPLPVRNILAYLTANVPGWGRIPSAKARRIVSAALEHRGGGGIYRNVVFEKAAWGKWTAYYRGQKPIQVIVRQRQGTEASNGDDQDLDDMSIDSLGDASVAADDADDDDDDRDEDEEDEEDKEDVESDRRSRKVRIIPVVPPPDDSDATDSEDWAAELPERPAMSYAASYNSRRDSHCSSTLTRPVPIPVSRRRPSTTAVSASAGAARVRKISASMAQQHASLDVSAIRSMQYLGGILPFHRVYTSSLGEALRAQGPKVAGATRPMLQPYSQRRPSNTALLLANSPPEDIEAVEALLQLRNRRV